MWNSEWYFKVLNIVNDENLKKASHEIIDKCDVRINLYKVDEYEILMAVNTVFHPMEVECLLCIDCIFLNMDKYFSIEYINNSEKKIWRTFRNLEYLKKLN
jgi:hypothetical protein